MMDPSPNDVLEKAAAVAVSNPEQAIIMLQTLGEYLCNPLVHHKLPYVPSILGILLVTTGL